ILFEDQHLLVVSKPSGVVSHPTASRRTGTLVNRLLGAGVPLAAAGGPDRPGIVHRLDVGTSGAMLVAKDDRTFEALSDLFRRHAIDRAYLALVRDRSPGAGRPRLWWGRGRRAPPGPHAPLPAFVAGRVRASDDQPTHRARGSAPPRSHPRARSGTRGRPRVGSGRVETGTLFRP